MIIKNIFPRTLINLLRKYENFINCQAISGFKLLIYCGQFILSATMTVSCEAISAMNKSAFVVKDYKDWGNHKAIDLFDISF